MEADRRQQAVRQLEMEISRFWNSFEASIESLPLLESVPPLEAVDDESLREAFMRNTHLFSEGDIQDITVEVMKLLDEIRADKRFFREGCENMGRVWCESYRDLNKVTQENLKEHSQNLLKESNRLEERTQLQPP